MRTPRIYTEQPLNPGLSLILEAEPSHHLHQVLRLKPDDSLRLFNGDGKEYACRIQHSERQGVAVKIQELLNIEPAPVLRIDLILGISRGERMDFAIQKAVELGVTGIQPVFTERCMVKLKGERLKHRMQHWQKIIIGACEQSGRCHLPNLLETENFPDALRNRDLEFPLLLDQRSHLSITDLRPLSNASTLLIGPEGGLSEEEQRLAENSGFTPIRLGPRVMRTETAPLAAIAAIQTLWGDFRGP